MNLDFGAEPLFSWYVVLLLLSGLAMVVIGATNFGAQSNGWRIFNVIAGLGFAGYGVYLGFFFQGGTYFVFFKAFILPVLLIVQFVKSLAAKNKAQAAPQQYTVPVNDQNQVG